MPSLILLWALSRVKCFHEDDTRAHQRLLRTITLGLALMAGLVPSVARAQTTSHVYIKADRVSKRIYFANMTNPACCTAAVMTDLSGINFPSSTFSCDVPSSQSHSSFNWQRRSVVHQVWEYEGNLLFDDGCDTGPKWTGCLSRQSITPAISWGPFDCSHDCTANDEAKTAPSSDPCNVTLATDSALFAVQYIWQFDAATGSYGYDFQDFTSTTGCGQGVFPNPKDAFVPANLGDSGTIEFFTTTTTVGVPEGQFGFPTNTHFKETVITKWSITITAPSIWPCDLGPTLDARSETQPTVGEASNGDGWAWLDAIGCVKGANPTDTDPIDLAEGDKLDATTDLLVEVSGKDFTIDRSYTSNPQYEAPILSGNRWTLSPFRFVKFTSGSPGELRIGGMARRTIKVPLGTAPWKMPGSTTQLVVKAGASVSSVSSLTVPVWRLIEPGQWEMDFYRARDEGETGWLSPSVHAEGLLLQVRDPYRNSQTYLYQQYGSGSSLGQAQVRLSKVLLDNDPNATSPEAEVRFVWDLNLASTNLGRLKEAQVVRFVGNPTSAILTQIVKYTYMDTQVPELSPSLGTDGDLVQVATYERVNPAPGASTETWRARITQYRYHDGATHSALVACDGSQNDWTYTWIGGASQLKMVINPQQIEFAAEKQISTVESHATWLLNRADDAAAWTSGSDPPRVMDLAAKIVEEYDSTTDRRVKTQYVLSSCGCGGASTQGRKKTYTYYDHDGAVPGATTIKVVETQADGSCGFATYRTNFFEITKLDGVPYMELSAIKDDTAANVGSWLTQYKYHGNRHHLIAEFTPAALSNYTSYTPGDNSNAPTLPSVGNGLVHVYEFENDRITKTRVSNGNPSIDSNGICSSCTLVESIEHGSNDSDNERKHLPKAIERYRAGSTTPDTVERVEFRYGFRNEAGFSSADDADDIAWIETKTEAELTSENGPGGSYFSHEFLDTDGNNNWSRAADDTLTRREFDSRTGAVTLAEINADDASSFPSHTGTDSSVTFAGRNSSNDNSLISTYSRDLLGRVHQQKSPGAVSAYTRYEMRDFPGRTGTQFLAIVELPHEITAGSAYDGAASITWVDAAGAEIGSSSYAIGSTGYTIASSQSGYIQVVTNYTLGNEKRRRWTEHTSTGLPKTKKAWHDIGGNRFHTNTLHYDLLGRLSYSVNNDESVIRHSYDVLDREIKIEAGIFGSNCLPDEMSTIKELFYDGGSSASQGIGNGNLTLVREYTAASSYRDTKYSYDWRDRRVKTELPNDTTNAVGHEIVVYDNLNRPVERGVFNDPSANSITSNSRRLHHKIAYSQRGLVVRTQLAIEPDPQLTSPGNLETNFYYDQSGRLICQSAPNSPAEKTTYDAIGRPLTTYKTDMAGGTSFSNVFSLSSHAAVLTGDTVFEQSSYRYITGSSQGTHVGMLDLVTTRERTHISTATGALNAAPATSSIISYLGTFYDGADRVIEVADFGSAQNTFESGGSEPTISQSSPPTESSNSVLVTKTSYNDRGLFDSNIDADNRSMKFLYDDLYRRKAVIENYVNADVQWDTTITPNRWVATGLNSTTDEDRVTSFVYNGENQMVVQVAHQDGSGGANDQVTTYQYGVTSSSGSNNSDISSRNLLFKAIYPPQASGQSESDRTVTYSYNRQSELKRYQDQNGTVHELTLDVNGRVTLDKATLAGSSPISNWANAIKITFDTLGRPQLVTTYFDYGGSNQDEVNEVRYSYDSLWHVTKIDQDVDDVVALDSNGNPDSQDNTHCVEYEYTSAPVSEGNYSRLTALNYPCGDEIGYDYDPNPLSTPLVPETPDDRISRVQSLLVGTSALVQYDRVGLSRIVIEEFPQIDVRLDYYINSSGESNEGKYPTFDRFGRIISHKWIDGGYGGILSTEPEEDYGTVPPIVHLNYSYDFVSNRNSAYDARAGAGVSWKDSEFKYDHLHRLKQADRGIRNGTTFTYAMSYRAVPGSQSWVLDMLGNWQNFVTDGDSPGNNASTGHAGDTQDARTHSAANELKGRNIDGAAGDELAYAYDKAGNLLSVNSTGTTYKHDAWNRLVEVKYGTETRALYEYNGLNWRTLKKADSDGLNGTLDQLRTMYYGQDWRLLEEDIDVDSSLTTANSDVDQQVVYIWGMRGLDDLAIRRQYIHDPEDLNTWYHLNDPQMSTVAILNDAAVLVERVGYTAYGEARHMHPWDLDGNGSSDSSDLAALYAIASSPPIIGSAGYNVDADVDRDGDVDMTDYSIANSQGSQYSLGRGPISEPTVDNVMGYAGYYFDREVLHYTVRHRTYEPVLGRFVQRDPAGYVSGSSLYGYVSGNPTTSTDPSGLFEFLGINFTGWNWNSQGNRPLEIISRTLGLSGRSVDPIKQPSHWESVDRLTWSAAADSAIASRDYQAARYYADQINYSNWGFHPQSQYAGPSYSAAHQGNAWAVAGLQGASELSGLTGGLDILNSAGELATGCGDFDDLSNVLLGVTTMASLTPSHGTRAAVLQADCACFAKITRKQRPGPLFNAEKLEKIVAAIRRQGGRVMMDEDAVWYLNSENAAAMYTPRPGEPGVFHWRPTPTRAEVVEELMHYGQFRLMNWPDVEANPLLIPMFEVEVQTRLLDYATRHNWTLAERQSFIVNRNYWRKRFLTGS